MKAAGLNTKFFIGSPKSIFEMFKIFKKMNQKMMKGLSNIGLFLTTIRTEFIFDDILAI